MRLLERKMGHVETTGAHIVATANPGCAVQLQHGLRRRGIQGLIMHPVSLLARAYRAEERHDALRRPSGAVENS